ncbi:MAG: RNA polymerase sigma factor [Oscillospiraceae bacterium]|nr:RNA polymerase sigma factor [Oscillospiraceae bacterium]
MTEPSVRPADEIEKTIEQYVDMLYRLCVIILKNESDAEDAVQETVLKLYRKSPSFQDEEHKKAWLIRVATNQCRDLLRFRLHHPQLEEEQLEKIGTEPPDSGILEALSELPEKYRIVLTLYYVEECSIKEIAKIICRTTSAVKMRLQKGRKLLEVKYREEYL